MFENPTLSRREFGIAAGFASLSGFGILNINQAPSCSPLAEWVTRCGPLRFGYCGSGGIAPEGLDEEHRRQIRLITAIWAPATVPAFYTAGAMGKGEAKYSALMTSLTHANGTRMEIVTSGHGLQGPWMTLRGLNGTLCAIDNVLWFSSKQDVFSERADAYPLPDRCWQELCTLDENTGPSTEYDGFARMVIASARERLTDRAPLKPC